MALTQENVHYTLNSGPGVVNKSNRVHARIQEFCQAWGGGGGGVEARRPENSVDNVFFSHQIILQFTEWIQWFYYSGEEGFQRLPGVGVSKETHITCDFRGGRGPDPLTPLWIRTWGRLTHRIMVYQNLNKIKKYHPTTTKRKKLSPAGQDSKCGSRGGSGGPDPTGKSQVIWVSIGYKQLDPPGKSWTPPSPR